MTVALKQNNSSKTHTQALKLLGWIVLILFGFPKLSLKVGPVPIYAIDILLFLLYRKSAKLPRLRFSYHQPQWVYAIVGLFIFSEFMAAIQMGTYLQPIYIIARTLLAASIYFSFPKIIRNNQDLIIILKYALVGALITALLLVLSSLGPTRFIANILFSIPFLEPSYASVTEKFAETEKALRGRSLVGVSILSGAFLNTIWALLLYMRGKKLFKQQRLLMYASVAIPFAILFTYSRGAILALLAVIFGILLYSSFKIRKLLIAVILLVITIISTIGWGSEYFFFERIENRTRIMLENPYEDDRETERLYAYTEPFEHLLENPEFLFVGQGFARRKVRGHTLGAGSDKATHAVFASAYYAYGMFASFLLICFLLQGLFYTWRKTKKRINKFSRALIPAILGFIPWFMLGHAAVSTTRGMILMFFLFALISIQSRMNRNAAYLY